MKNTIPYLLFGVKRVRRVLALSAALAWLLMLSFPVQAQTVNLYTGSSTHTVPIVTPAGTNGVGPSLSLDYSSDSGDGWLGVGWDLTGLGSVERVGAAGGAPTYSASDTFRLSLGGAHKLVYAGTDPAGTAGNYYRTEIESFLRIEFVSASNSWVVTDKGGTTYFLGQNAASQQNNPGNAAQVFSWKLDKVLDTHGVFWTVSYSKDTVNGDMYPAQIVYSQGQGLACTPSNLAACRTVDFVLAPRTTADVPVGYRTGGKIASDQLLRYIDVKLGGNLIRRYDLRTDYFSNAVPTSSGDGPRKTARRTHLTNIIEYGADGDFLPGTTFVYNNNSADSFSNPSANTLTQTSMTGDPAGGLGGPGPNNPPLPRDCTHAIDMNNDGLDDVLVGTSGNWYYYPNLGANDFGARVNIPNPLNVLPTLCNIKVVGIYKKKPRFQIFGSGELQVQSSADNGQSSAGGGGEGSIVWRPGRRSFLRVGEIVTAVNDAEVIDLDGDGLNDVVHSPGVGQWYWWRGLAGVQFANRASFVNPPPIKNDDTATRFVDMNGDGLVDLLQLEKISTDDVAYTSTWRIRWWRNQGRDTAGAIQFEVSSTLIEGIVLNHFHPYPYSPNAFGVYAPPETISILDMNGDGLPDLMWMAATAAEGDNWTAPNMASRVFVPYYLPNRGGTGFGDRVPMEGSTAFSTPSGPSVYGLDLKVQIVPWAFNLSEHHRLVDVNGDGLPDLMEGYAGLYRYWPLQANGKFGNPVDLAGSPSSTLTIANYMALADTNGDGFVDILKGTETGGTTDYVNYSLNMSDSHQKLESVYAPMGGTLGFGYQRLRSGSTIRWVTSQVSQTDGLGAVNAATYSYTGGKHVGWPHNEFRGYATATVTDPAGHASITAFHQDDARKGRTRTVETRSNGAGGALMTRTSLLYNLDASAPGVSRVDLASQQIDTYDGGASFKFARTDYGLYDAFGNALLATSSGTDVSPRVTVNEFAYNSAAYIVDRPRRTESRIDSATGTKTGETWFDYDGLANGAAPTRGDLTRETRWFSAGVNPVTQYAYDAYGNRIGTIDARLSVCSSTGYSARVAFDATYQSFPVTETNALCQATGKTYWGVNTTLSASAVSGAYSVPGLPATATDPNGVRSDSYWDSFGRPRASVRPPDTAAFPTTTWTYTVTGSAPSTTRESKRESAGASGTLDTYTHIDGLGRTIQVKSEAEAAGQWITQDTWYNSRGMTESVNVPYLTTYENYSLRNTAQPKTTTLYDAVGRATRVTSPDNTFRTNAYTPYVVASADEKTYVTTRTYDAAQRLISVVEPAGGGTTTYYYDSFLPTGANLQLITNAAGRNTLTYFDTLGRRTSLNDPDLGIWSFTYDANGNLLTQRDAKLQTLTFEYDELNRLSGKVYPGTAGGVGYLYDLATPGAHRIGRLAFVSDPAGGTWFYYDQRGRVTRTNKTIAGVSYTTQTSYDSLDRVVTTTYPDNEVVQNTYNAQGLLERVRSTTYNADYVANLDYNALGKVTAKTLGNGKVTSYDYFDTAAEGPLNFRLRNVSTPGLQNLTYGYDLAGNVSGVTDSLKANSQTFGYDDLHRLTLASSRAVPAFTHVFNYDATGNMTIGAGKNFTYPAPSAARPHAPTSDGACNYGYDANGSLTTRTCGAVTRTFTWNYDNRVSQVQDGSTVLAAFTYDYAGQRVRKVEGATTTVKPFAHYRTVNGAVTKYYFANGERAAERTGPAATDVFYYHPDHLGSSNTVSSSAGAEVKATLFYPYGSTRTETGTKSLAFQYTGQEKDTSTGLYNYGARYYDPAFMHFISADNIIPDAADPQMLNRYSYVRGNPIRLKDPTGKSPVQAYGDFLGSDYLSEEQRYGVESFNSVQISRYNTTWCPTCTGASLLAIGYSLPVAAGATRLMGLAAGSGREMIAGGALGSGTMSPGMQYVTTGEITGRGIYLDMVFGATFQRVLGASKSLSQWIFPESWILQGQANFFIGGVAAGGTLVYTRARLEGGSHEDSLFAAGLSRVPAWPPYSLPWASASIDRKLAIFGTGLRSINTGVSYASEAIYSLIASSGFVSDRYGSFSYDYGNGYSYSDGYTYRTGENWWDDPWYNE